MRRGLVLRLSVTAVQAVGKRWLVTSDQLARSYRGPVARRPS